MEKCPYCEENFDEVILDIYFCGRCKRAYCDSLGDKNIKRYINSINDYRKSHTSYLSTLLQNKINGKVNKRELSLVSNFEIFTSLYSQFNNNLDTYKRPPKKEGEDIFYFPYADYKQFVRAVNELLKYIDR